MIRVHDDVLADPQAYRAAVLAQPFASVDVGDAIFHGIAPPPDGALTAWFEATYPQWRVTLAFCRQSPAGQVEPNDIHTDADMGDVTAIVYLTPDPPPGDGTTFWRQRDNGAVAGPIGAGGPRSDAWEVWRTVPAAFNRCVVFAAPAFHSRAIAENYGAGDDARLIQVLFAQEKD